jgi:hypothetical protein
MGFKSVQLVTNLEASFGVCSVEALIKEGMSSDDDANIDGVILLDPNHLGATVSDETEISKS